MYRHGGAFFNPVHDRNGPGGDPAEDDRVQAARSGSSDVGRHHAGRRAEQAAEAGCRPMMEYAVALTPESGVSGNALPCRALSSLAQPSHAEECCAGAASIMGQPSQAFYPTCRLGRQSVRRLIQSSGRHRRERLYTTGSQLLLSTHSPHSGHECTPAPDPPRRLPRHPARWRSRYAAPLRSPAHGWGDGFAITGSMRWPTSVTRRTRDQTPDEKVPPAEDRQR